MVNSILFIIFYLSYFIHLLYILDVCNFLQPFAPFCTRLQLFTTSIFWIENRHTTRRVADAHRQNRNDTMLIFG